MITRFTLACFLAVCLSGVVEGLCDTQRRSKPNVLIILCDDLGYGDLACYGHPAIKTPSLDKLASQGVRLTNCYAASPVCSPSRAGLLTGRTPSRVGVYDWIPEEHAMHMPRGEVTVAQILKRAGYDTAMAGKWHLNGKFNSPEQPQPGDFGFDHWLATQNNAAPSHENPINFVRNGEPVGKVEGYSCQVVADEAIGWLKGRGDKANPFFLYVAFHEPHEPIASPSERVAQYPDVTDPNQALYYANVTNMDAAVGRLMAALDALKLADDTLVIFTSDNGPEGRNRYRGAERSYGSPGELRGMKLWLYEGGIRVPGIVRFPSRVKPGQVVSDPVCSLDILPTLCELAGVDVPKDRALDGASFTPLFEGKPIERTTPLYWHYYRALGEPVAAMRVGDWMVLGHSTAPEPKPGKVQPGDGAAIKADLTGFELYNLRDDPGQQTDRARQEPERLKELSAMLVAKHREVAAEGPLWDGADR